MVDNTNAQQDINLSSDNNTNIRQRDKRVKIWEREQRIKKERHERYERVLKQYDEIVTTIIASEALKRNLRKQVFNTTNKVFLGLTEADYIKCIEQISKLLNNEWKDDFLRFFKKKYWTEEIGTNLKIQRGHPKTFRGEIMEDTVLNAFYHFLMERVEEASSDFVVTYFKSAQRDMTPILEWRTRIAILQTLCETHENSLFPIIKRDSCYFLEKTALNREDTVVERKFSNEEALEIISCDESAPYEDLEKRLPEEVILHIERQVNAIIPIWKIDPKYRSWDDEKLYTLFEKAQKIEIYPKRGRPSENIELRQGYAGEVIASAESLFNRVWNSLYDKAGGKTQKREGLYGACFYVAAIYKWLWYFGVGSTKFDHQFVKIMLKHDDIPHPTMSMLIRPGVCIRAVALSIFPVKSLKYWGN